MKNFFIIRLSSLGDIIHTLPAFSSLRRNFPDAHISWIVEKQGKEILDLVPGLDEVIVFRQKGWLKSIKKRNQIVLDFQGLIKSGLIAFLSRSQKRIGFDPRNLKEPSASPFYTDSLEKVSEEIHVIIKNLRLLSKLGIKEEKYEFPLTIPNETSKAVKEKLKKIGFPSQKKLIICNIGAAWETKRWSALRWVRLLKLMKKEDLFPLLLWGNEREGELARAVSEQSRVTISPFFSIKEVLALIKEASLVISGDTFALQVACAFSVPVIGLFGPTNPERNGPFNPRDKVAFAALNCAPCYKRTCPAHLNCMDAISSEKVAKMAHELLEKNA